MPRLDPGSGTIDYAGALAGAQAAASPAGATGRPRPVPVDSSGMVDAWHLDRVLQPQYDSNGKIIQKAPLLWFDTGRSAGKKQPGMGEHGGGGGFIDAPSSFNVNKSASDIMKQFAAMSANDPLGFEAIQKLLYRGQFYSSSGRPDLGWGKATEAALNQAMIAYLQVSKGAGVGVSFRDWIQKKADLNDPSGTGQVGGSGAGGAGGAGGSAGPPPGPSLTDPDQLRLYAQKAAQSALGRNLNSAQLDNFVKQFHDQQIQSFNTAQAGGQDVQKNDPSASAISFVTGNNQQEFNQHQTQGYADSFLNMFLSGPSSAPNMNVDQSAGGI